MGPVTRKSWYCCCCPEETSPIKKTFPRINRVESSESYQGDNVATSKKVESVFRNHPTRNKNTSKENTLTGRRLGGMGNGLSPHPSVMEPMDS
jgi:hypothetical protein